MRSRLWGGAVALLISCGFLVSVSAPVSAGTPPAAATGDVTCTVGGGKVSFKPKLTAASQANVVAKFSLSLKPCTGTTGNAAATLTGATLKAVSAPYTASCTNPQPPALTATVKWKAKKGKFATSTIAWTSTTGDGDHINLAATASTISGSYAADGAAASLLRSTSSDCAKGIPSWKLDPVNSTFTVKVPPVTCATPPAPDAIGTATGSNGNEWIVVVPTAQYPAACHPTGTMSSSWNQGSCASQTNVALSDSGTMSASLPPPVTNESDFWGIDTGLTTSAAAACGGLAGASYSGDSIYAPATFDPCGSNIPTTLGTAFGSSGVVWFVVVPNVAYGSGCAPSGALAVTVSSPLSLCTASITVPPADFIHDSGTNTVTEGHTNPGANYQGVQTGIAVTDWQSLCTHTTLTVHATFTSASSHYEGFST